MFGQQMFIKIANLIYYFILKCVLGLKISTQWGTGRVWGSISPQRSTPIRSRWDEGGFGAGFGNRVRDGRPVPKFRPVAIPSTNKSNDFLLIIQVNLHH